MKVEQVLFKHYDEVVDSPEAVSKLRKFILDFGGAREVGRARFQ